MRNQDFVSAFGIGDSARHFQQPVIRASGETQVLDGGAEQGFHLFGGRAVGAKLFRTHLRVAEERAEGLGAFRSREINFSRRTSTTLRANKRVC